MRDKVEIEFELKITNFKTMMNYYCPKSLNYKKIWWII